MNPLKAIFLGIGHFFEDVWDKLKGGQVVAAASEVMAAAKQYEPEAIKALQVISQLAPNKTTEELTALATKYEIQTAGVDFSDQSHVQAFLLTAAEKEVRQFVPATVPDAWLDFIVQAAFAALSKQTA